MRPRRKHLYKEVLLTIHDIMKISETDLHYTLLNTRINARGVSPEAALAMPIQEKRANPTAEWKALGD